MSEVSGRIVNGLGPAAPAGTGRASHDWAVDPPFREGIFGGADPPVVEVPRNGRYAPDPPVHLLIVDDCALSRDNLATALARRGHIVGVAWDAASVLRADRGWRPAVVLVNVGSLDSALLMTAAAEANPQARIVAIGVHDDDEDMIVGCAEAGAIGYHTRGQSLADLLELIGRVAGGEVFCAPRISAVLLRRLSDLAAQPPPAQPDPLLTCREIEVLGLVRLGLSNKQIATELCIAVHTVKNHVHNLLAKLDVKTRAEAAALPAGR